MFIHTLALIETIQTIGAVAREAARIGRAVALEGTPWSITDRQHVVEEVPARTERYTLCEGGRIHTGRTTEAHSRTVCSLRYEWGLSYGH